MSEAREVIDLLGRRFHEGKHRVGVWRLDYKNADLIGFTPLKNEHQFPDHFNSVVLRRTRICLDSSVNPPPHDPRITEGAHTAIEFPFFGVDDGLPG